MPSAIKAGLTYKEAMHMTPKAIEMHIEAYSEKEQEKVKVSEYLSWLNGYYVVEAIACTFGKGNTLKILYRKIIIMRTVKSQNQNCRSKENYLRQDYLLHLLMQN